MVWKYAGRYVLPFSPSNMKMSIRWNTAVADTISSVNTRSLSKEYPQFTVNYSALLKGAGLQFAVDRVLRDLGQEVLVPMWQDVAVERLSDTEVTVDTEKTFYKVGLSSPIVGFRYRVADSRCRASKPYLCQVRSQLY